MSRWEADSVVMEGCYMPLSKGEWSVCKKCSIFSSWQQQVRVLVTFWFQTRWYTGPRNAHGMVWAHHMHTGSFGRCMFVFFLSITEKICWAILAFSITTLLLWILWEEASYLGAQRQKLVPHLQLNQVSEVSEDWLVQQKLGNGQ